MEVIKLTDGESPVWITSKHITGIKDAGDCRIIYAGQIYMVQEEVKEIMKRLMVSEV